MKKEMKRYFASMALTAAMTAAMSFPAFAARIAFSDPSGNVGDEITVNMKITGSDGETINSSDVMLSYDSSALAGCGKCRYNRSNRVKLCTEIQGIKSRKFPDQSQHPGSV